jgi:ABC-type dipeptide/oligopeptide/nickel transport system, ATPase component
MYKGKIVEQGDGDQVFANPQQDTPAGCLPQFLNQSRIAGNVCRHEDPTLRRSCPRRRSDSTACSGGKQETPSAGGSAEVGTTNDINPKDVSALQQGGNLRLALTAFPENFNSLNIDGNSADSAGMLKASMPGRSGSPPTGR